MSKPESADENPAALTLLLKFSEINPELRERGHQMFELQRTRAPIERDLFFPAILASSYAPAREVLSDPNLSRDIEAPSPENPIMSSMRRLNEALESEFGPHATMLWLGGEEHQRVRSVVAEPFLRRIAAMRPWIDSMIAEEIDRQRTRQSFEVIGDYAGRIPMRILGRLLGLSERGLDQFKNWSDAGQQAFNMLMTEADRSAMLDARRQLLQALSDALRERRNAPSEDLVSDLARAQADGQPISDVEIVHNLFALVAAGHLTTTDMIGNGAWLLLSNPDQRAALLAHPELATSAVDEILRSEPPISFTARFAHKEGELRGCPVHKGDTVAVSLMAVNRDPAVFPDPHKFDIARGPNPHLAFGAGAHICLGAPLARFVGQRAILALFQSFPHLRLASDAPPRWKASPGIRGLERLDVLT